LACGWESTGRGTVFLLTEREHSEPPPEPARRALTCRDFLDLFGGRPRKHVRSRQRRRTFRQRTPKTARPYGPSFGDVVRYSFIDVENTSYAG
jgi:hypothetical protein